MNESTLPPIVSRLEATRTATLSTHSAATINVNSPLDTAGGVPRVKITAMPFNTAFGTTMEIDNTDDSMSTASTFSTSTQTVAQASKAIEYIRLGSHCANTYPTTTNLSPLIQVEMLANCSGKEIRCHLGFSISMSLMLLHRSTRICTLQCLQVTALT